MKKNTKIMQRIMRNAFEIDRLPNQWYSRFAMSQITANDFAHRWVYSSGYVGVGGGLRYGYGL